MTLKFEVRQIAAEAFEAATFCDVDGDGVLDIVSGGFWYRGPDFRQRRLIQASPRRINDYYDDFSAILLDVDGDGRPDLITGGWWGESLRWYKNPGGQTDATWQEAELAGGCGAIETTRAWDVDGDGKLEIVPNTPGSPLCAYRLDGRGGATRHELYPEPLGHGLGFGDLNGSPAFATPRGILRPRQTATPGPATGSSRRGRTSARTPRSR